MDGVIGWIREVVMDCTEPWELARFWAGLLGGAGVEWCAGWVTPEPPPRGQRLSFQATAAVPDREAARVHFEVLVDDLAAAGDRVVAAGAVFLREHVSPRPGPGGEPVGWRVYLDPAGHPVCLVERRPQRPRRSSRAGPPLPGERGGLLHLPQPHPQLG